MKKIFNKFGLLIGILIFIILVLVIYYINNDDYHPLVPNVNITQESVNLSVNNKASLLVYVQNVSNYLINWESSNPSVASVNTLGTVTALSEGSTIITASYIHTDGKIYTDNCLINVIGGQDIRITDITFPGEELVISKNSETIIEPIVLPTEATINNVKYSSSNTDIATITSDGVLKTLKKGNVMIEVTVNDKYTDYLRVNVVDEISINEYITVPTALILDDTKLELKEDETKTITYRISPSDASDKYLVWESSNNDVVSVVDGVVTANKVGQAIITVSYNSQVLDSIIVSVSKKTISVTDVTLTATSTELKVNETLQLDYKVFPTDATNQSVVFKSSDDSIATVSQTGLVTGKKVGNVTITITTLDGNYTRSVALTVKSGSSGSSGESGSTSGGPYQGSTGETTCTQKSPNLSLIYNGRSIAHDSTITMHVGETIYIKVLLPNYCGSDYLITSTIADGETGWRNYLSGMSVRSSGNNASSYEWKLTANKVTSGVTVSQTALFQTELYYSVKSMARIVIKVLP